jgi:hypothetical protein
MNNTINAMLSAMVSTARRHASARPLAMPLAFVPLALIVGLSLLLVGCDSTPQGTAGTDNRPLLQVTNDLSERMTVFGDEAESNQFFLAESVPLGDRTAKKALTLRAVSHIRPPSSGYSAGHLTVGRNDVFAAYKIPGSSFGGGVDILDANNPTQLTNEDNALISPDLDVQEVAYERGAPNRLYIAGAVDFEAIEARDFGGTPAVMIRAEIEDNGNVARSGQGNVRAVEAAMPHNLVKSVTAATSNDGDHNVYAVTDGGSLFEFNGELGNRVEINSGSSTAPDAIGAGAEFSSVASLDGENYAQVLTKDGTTYSVGTAGPDDGKVYERALGLSTVTTNGIARLSGHDHSGGGNSSVTAKLLYGALNSGGLVVLDRTGSTKLYEKTDQYYVSVTAADYSNGTSRVYAAGPGGQVDVFEVTSAITDGNVSTGLQLEGSFDLGGLQEIGTGSGGIGSADVNQILAQGDYLYVAASGEGIVVLEIDGNGSDIF